VLCECVCVWAVLWTRGASTGQSECAREDTFILCSRPVRAPHSHAGPEAARVRWRGRAAPECGQGARKRGVWRGPEAAHLRALLLSTRRVACPCGKPRGPSIHTHARMPLPTPRSRRRCSPPPRLLRTTGAAGARARACVHVCLAKVLFLWLLLFCVVLWHPQLPNTYTPRRLAGAPPAARPCACSSRARRPARRTPPRPPRWVVQRRAGFARGSERESSVWVDHRHPLA